MNDRHRIFQLLDKPPKPLGILSVEIDLAKRECQFGCIYDVFNEPLSFYLRFIDVKAFEWFVTEDAEQYEELPADVLFIVLGNEQYVEPCVIATIEYGFKLLYSKLHIEVMQS